MTEPSVDLVRGRERWIPVPLLPVARCVFPLYIITAVTVRICGQQLLNVQVSEAKINMFTWLLTPAATVESFSKKGALTRLPTVSVKYQSGESDEWESNPHTGATTTLT